MYCKTCGTNNPDNVRFCKECGEVMNPRIPATGKTSGTHPKFGFSKKCVLTAIAAVVIVVFAIVLLGGGKRGQATYKSVVNQLVKSAYKTADAEDFFELIPDAVIDYSIEDEDYYDLDEMVDDFQYELDYLHDYLYENLGRNWSVSSKIVDVQDFTDRELRELNRDYKDVLETDIEISAAKVVEVELTIKGDDLEQSNVMEINVIKINGKWYLDFMSFYGF